MLARGVWIYPIAVLAFLYMTWLTAWAVLGHVPRPNLDDPKYISWLVDGPYLVAMLLMQCAPAAMLLGLIFAAPNSEIRKKLMRTIALALLWAAVLGVLRLDPLGVATWFMD